MSYATTEEALAALTHKCRHLSMRVSLEHCARYRAADINDKGNPRHKGKTPRYSWCQNCPGPIPLDGSAESTPVPAVKLEKMRPNRFSDMRERSEARKEEKKRGRGPSLQPKPHRCTTCGQKDPSKFSGNNKSICEKCRVNKYTRVKVTVQCPRCGNWREVQKAMVSSAKRYNRELVCMSCTRREVMAKKQLEKGGIENAKR